MAAETSWHIDIARNYVTVSVTLCIGVSQVGNEGCRVIGECAYDAIRCEMLF